MSSTAPKLLTNPICSRRRVTSATAHWITLQVFLIRLIHRQFAGEPLDSWEPIHMLFILCSFFFSLLLYFFARQSWWTPISLTNQSKQQHNFLFSFFCCERIKEVFFVDHVINNQSCILFFMPVSLNIWMIISIFQLSHKRSRWYNAAGLDKDITGIDEVSRRRHTVCYTT